MLTGILFLFTPPSSSSVLLTDLPEYAPLLKKNIEHNKNQITGQLEFLELAWGNSTHIEAAKKTRPDILLVSDCIYYKASIGPLLDTLVALSSSSSSSEPTVVYLCYEERTSDEKKSVLKRFFDLVEEQDFFSVHTYSTSQCHPDYASDDIKIIRLQQKK